MKHLEYAPVILLSLFTTKLLILNSWSFESAIVLAALAGAAALFHLKSKNDEMEALKEQLQAQAKELEDLKKSDEAIRSSIAGLKLSAGIKPAAMKF